MPKKEETKFSLNISWQEISGYEEHKNKAVPTTIFLTFQDQNILISRTFSTSNAHALNWLSDCFGNKDRKPNEPMANRIITLAYKGQQAYEYNFPLIWKKKSPNLMYKF